MDPHLLAADLLAAIMKAGAVTIALSLLITTFALTRK